MASRPLADIVADLRNASVSGELTDAQRLELFEPLLSIAATLSKLSSKTKRAPKRGSSSAVAPLERRSRPTTALEEHAEPPKRRRQAPAAEQTAAGGLEARGLEAQGLEAVALAAPAEPAAKQTLAAFFATEPVEELIASADSQRLQDLKRKLLKQKGSTSEGVAERLASHLGNLASLFQALRSCSPDDLHAIMETVASSVLDRWPLGQSEQGTALLQSLASFSQELMDELTRRDIRYIRVLAVSSKYGGSSSSGAQEA